jgi:outer membrane protein OmpA-like peptidoglycan-associated protein
MKIIGMFLMVCGLVAAQSPQAANSVQPLAENASGMAAGAVPVSRAVAIGRTAKAINYRHRDGFTKIDFRGTPLLPDARGEATVGNEQGPSKIDARMENLPSASKFGPEYLTYVMWAITPEGHALNVGEVVLDGDKAKLDATTDQQSFGLIVTAEPYFAVSQPSDTVVLENVARRDTPGTIEQAYVRYEILPRGHYTLNANPAEIDPLPPDSDVSLDLSEARNAVRIARWAGAERYAPDTFQKAVQGLQNAQHQLNGKAGIKTMGAVAREAVQMAEDARVITTNKIDEERLAPKRQAAADREARVESERPMTPADAAAVTQNAEAAPAAAQPEGDRVKHDDTAKTEAVQNQASSAKREEAVETAAAKDEIGRLRGDDAAWTAAAEAETNRLSKKSDARTADAEVRSSAHAESDGAAKQLRAQLLRQFNAILETRDTSRGLIVNVPDALFDTGKYSLQPLARQMLAKVAGVVLGHPGLRLDVECHTDGVGGDEYNRRLSEQCGTAVRDYLTQVGMAASSVTAKSFGNTQPAASNDTAKGRQQNRRVELVISGDVIGSEIGTPIAAR